MSAVGWAVAVVGFAILIAVTVNIVLEKGDREVAAILAQAEEEKGTDADLLTIARGTGVDRTPDSGYVTARDAILFAAGALVFLVLCVGALFGMLG